MTKLLALVSPAGEVGLNFRSEVEVKANPEVLPSIYRVLAKLSLSSVETLVVKCVVRM